MNLPNKLTVARCIMTIFFVALMSFQHVITYCLAYLLFIAAAITDYYDGKIAREQNLITNFGKLLDPVADKVLLAAAFVMLMKTPPLWIPPWTVVVVLAREFLITGARALAAAQGVVIPANKAGKTKTVLQLVYVFTFLFLVIAYKGLELASRRWYDLLGGLMDPLRAVVAYSSLAAIVLVAAYTVYSGIQFARTNWKILQI